MVARAAIAVTGGQRLLTPRRPSTGAALAMLAGCVSAVACAAAAAAPFSASSHMTPVRQWGTNFGYCGEASFIAAGKRFGQYTSQWTARHVASSLTDQTRERSQLLLGTALPDGNAQTAAAAMRLDLVAYDGRARPTTPGYLAWIKQHVVAGDAVIMAVLVNMPMLGEQGPGDSEYDHIVPVMSVGSDTPLDGDNASTYFPTDTLTISDNGLAGLRSTLFTAPFAGIQRTRSQANRGRGRADRYSVLSPTTASTANYAVAVTGVTDDSPGGPYVLPVSVSTSRNSEGAPAGDIMRRPPPAAPMALTATVRIPDSSRAYRLYEYTSFAAIPRGSFNAAASAHPTRVAHTWDIPPGSGPTFVVRLRGLRTNGTYAFRAVPVSAP